MLRYIKTNNPDNIFIIHITGFNIVNLCSGGIMTKSTILLEVRKRWTKARQKEWKNERKKDIAENKHQVCMIQS